MQVGHDRPRNVQRVRVGRRKVIRHTARLAVHGRAAELLRGDHLAGGRAHQRRAAEKHSAIVGHNHTLVGHCGHVRAAGRARTHHDGDLRNAARRHVGLIEKDAAKVVAVGKHVGLIRQVGAARVDEVDARQAVLRGDLLRAQVLLDGDRVVGAALRVCVINRGQEDAETEE